VTIRPATANDHAVLRELYEAFYAEVPPPDYRSVDLEKEWAEVVEMIRDEVTLVAEEDGLVTGFVLAKMKEPELGLVADVFVRPEARGTGVARGLMREANARLRERGARVVTLDVQAANTRARRFYERLGFQTESLVLWAKADEVERRAADRVRQAYGTVHVQSDDKPRVEQAVLRFIPRLGRSSWTAVGDPANGWIAVADELAGGDPEHLRRLARELSDRLGSVTVALGVEDEVVHYVLYDRGRVVDEYVSVPEYFGPLPPGDVVALSANPTVVARLTGADPARVREVARTAESTAELPPAGDLYRTIADLMGLTVKPR
jgi:ribosomal protein S18 acetylase RimI-like enzyme